MPFKQGISYLISAITRALTGGHEVYRACLFATPTTLDGLLLRDSNHRVSNHMVTAISPD